MTVRMIVGDCREELRWLPSNHFQTVITSPPYWGLRDYGIGDAGIGLEPTLEEHLAALVEVFREVRRVLRPDGTVWLNYGDAYAGSWGAQGHRQSITAISGSSIRNYPKRASHTGTIREAGLKPKDLMFLPFRLASALQADGWWVRSEIIWHKRNAKPDSAKDRPACAHEKIWLLTRNEHYFYDSEGMKIDASPNPGRVNRRNVWSVATQPYRGPHFAVFPPSIVDLCLRGGVSEEGACARCGAPWGRVLERSAAPRDWEHRKGSGEKMATDRRAPPGGGDGWAEYSPRTIGWEPTCDCIAPAVPCRVLDPFAGAGTVGLVAEECGHDSTLIEFSPAYADMAVKRIEDRLPDAAIKVE